MSARQLHPPHLPKRIATASESLFIAAGNLRAWKTECFFGGAEGRVALGFRLSVVAELAHARAEIATWIVEQLLADRERVAADVFETATRMLREMRARNPKHTSTRNP